MSDIAINHHDHLDAALLEDILALIDQVTAIEGHAPMGEHKHTHLGVGASGWDGITARDASGRLIGYGHIRWTGDDLPRAALEVVAHPGQDTAAVATSLIQRAADVIAAEGGGTVHLWEHRVDDPATTVPAHLGWAIQRELAVMERALLERPQVAVPDEVTLAPLRPGTDDEAFLAVNNAAFEGHPENGGWDTTELTDRLSRDWVDPAGIICAWRGEELLGFHWTKRHEPDDGAEDPVGEVYILGIDPQAQGLGLGRVLLDAGLAHLHDRGCRRVILYVDRASGGAVRLYERAGFRLTNLDVCYEAVLPPSGSPLRASSSARSAPPGSSL